MRTLWRFDLGALAAALHCLPHPLPFFASQGLAQTLVDLSKKGSEETSKTQPKDLAALVQSLLLVLYRAKVVKSSIWEELKANGLLEILESSEGPWFHCCIWIAILSVDIHWGGGCCCNSVAVVRCRGGLR